MTELVGLKCSPTVDAAARDALATIQASIIAKRDLRIVTAKGSDVTNSSGMYKEKLQEEVETSIDDVVIAITELQGNKLQAELGGTNYGSARPAVLVTDDRNMRVKAGAKHLFAISGSVLKSILQPQAPRAHSSKTNRKTNPGSDTMASLKLSFPDATDEERVSALNDADGNHQTAAMILYTNKHANTSKKRHKIGAPDAGRQLQPRKP